jgi:small subunit ribosomal protein S4
MAHYTGPKGRINRRLGGVIFESGGAVRAYDRRPTPPGMAPLQRKLSKYGEAMREKQKIKYYYGLGERQLRRMFDHARRQTGNTGENLLLLCERRLDSVVRLAGFSKTRPQARQGAAHGHFTLNGHRCDVASTQVRVGDVVRVKRRDPLVALYAGLLAEKTSEASSWITVDPSILEAVVVRLPDAKDITLPVNVGIVVELMSR